jgi:hypothetical protein
MADSERFPTLPAKQWWALRTKFKQTIPTRVTPAYLAAALGMQEKSAKANVLPALLAVGLINSDGIPTERAKRWRDDDQYADVLKEMREQIYPTDLLEAIPNPKDNRASTERWFANRTGHGLSAAQKMANFYELLTATDSREQAERTVTENLPVEEARRGPDKPIARPQMEGAFKLPGGSYGELTKVVRAYLPYSEPSNLTDVSAAGGLHSTSVSRHNAFLMALGVLEGGQKKMLTPRGRSLAHALDHDIQDEIQRAWRAIAQENDFVQKVLSAVRIRNGMDADTLQAHIAYSAGQPRTASVLSAAATLIDVLRGAALLEEREGKLIASAVQQPQPFETRGKTEGDQETRLSQSNRVPVDILQTGAGVTVAIEIKVSCTVNELDELGEKLRRLFDDLRKSQQPTEEAQ